MIGGGGQPHDDQCDAQAAEGPVLFGASPHQETHLHVYVLFNSRRASCVEANYDNGAKPVFPTTGLDTNMVQPATPHVSLPATPRCPHDSVLT